MDGLLVHSQDEGQENKPKDDDDDSYGTGGGSWETDPSICTPHKGSWDGRMVFGLRPKEGQASRIVQERVTKFERQKQGLLHGYKGARSIEDFDLGKKHCS
ncbi:unnamed protein product [Dovyalis caffra]|uniref:Uncharacterized protein n=1 Tax=Dovyalis caffra TaxID=77055 RepID=A0AAV1QSU6_9ROSI|nr:unnamed protein product [Dovyalis caffra]